MKTTSAPSGLPGISSAIQRVNRRLQELATGSGPVLILGEQGTEKSFAAKIIHRLSLPEDRPLARVTVSWKLPPDFGQYFIRCQGGSLLVQLQKDIPVDIQYTLVEIANHGSFADPLSGEVIESDARVFLLHRRPFERLLQETPLLPELRELLEHNRVEIPPLRDRPEDIPALVRYAIARTAESGRSMATGANPQVLRLFRQWHWPGNAEDLMLVTAQAALAAREGQVAIDHLPEHFLHQIPEPQLEAARAIPVPDVRTAPPARPPKPAASAGELSNDDRTLRRIYSNAQDVLPLVMRTGDPPERDTTRETSGKEPPTPGPAGEIEGQTDLPPRVRQLLVRLNAQADLLSRQLTGIHRTPPPPFTVELPPEERTARARAWAELEERLDRGVDRVLALRRQIAALNLRRRQAVEGLKALLARLSHGFGATSGLDPAESAREAHELIQQLDDMELMIQELSERLPELVRHEAAGGPDPGTSGR